MKVTVVAIVIGALGTIIKELIGKGTGKLGNKKSTADHLDHSIIQIGQNTKESPGNLRSIAVTQTPIKKQLEWKTLEGLKQK